jgi:hypothetical protein
LKVVKIKRKIFTYSLSGGCGQRNDRLQHQTVRKCFLRAVHQLGGVEVYGNLGIASLLVVTGSHFNGHAGVFQGGKSFLAQLFDG